MTKILLRIALALAACAVQAQEFPSRAVRIVVPWPPSGNVDITARAVAPALAEALANEGVRERYRAMGADVWEMSQPQFNAYVRDDVEKWRKVAREANIVVE